MLLLGFTNNLSKLSIICKSKH